MTTSGRARAIAMATARSSAMSRSSCPNRSMWGRGAAMCAIAAPSWPRAPSTATRILGGLLDSKRAHPGIVEDAFPSRDDSRGDTVAHHVDGRPAHVQDLIDTEENRGTLERQ